MYSNIKYNDNHNHITNNNNNKLLQRALPGSPRGADGVLRKKTY